jgi:hypothetical protein
VSRSAFDVVLMFMILLLPRASYSLSDAQVEYQVADRLSFQRFAKIGIEAQRNT